MYLFILFTTQYILLPEVLTSFPFTFLFWEGKQPSEGVKPPPALQNAKGLGTSSSTEASQAVHLGDVAFTGLPADRQEAQRQPLLQLFERLEHLTLIAKFSSSQPWSFSNTAILSFFHLRLISPWYLHMCECRLCFLSHKTMLCYLKLK